MAPEELFTNRLMMRKPTTADANAIFKRYAADPAVCEYLAWPRHQSVADTRAFIEFSNNEWRRMSVGPYLIFNRDGSQLYGSTGLEFQAGGEATTGYVLARDQWGKGYATEALIAMRDLAAELGTSRLFSYVHPDHQPSRHVLEKAGFKLEKRLSEMFEFPNLAPGKMLDVVSYAWTPDQ